MRRSRPLSDAEWLAQQFEGLSTELEVITPSAWAESKRYLPPSVTPMPGYFRFDIVPYMREIVDCLSVDSPIREVALMKGAQVTATTAVLENAIGYYIDHVKTVPIMLATADNDLAKIRLEQYITPMLQHSGLEHLVQSADETNARKTGKTQRKLEWVGGGFLLLYGAQNANKLRSFSVQILLRDEIDGWPLIVGKDGDPIELSAARTAAYEESRKILDLSTPLVKGTSQIEKRFARGDQRYYYVRCRKCSYPQTLRWRHTDPETGETTGIVWETEQGRLVPGSVRYRCCNCSYDHINADKTWLLSPEHGAEWRPTAEPLRPDIRSYHLSALYSPVGMQSWESCVQAWLEAWDEENGRVKDVPKLQVFYNNVLGEAFETRGERLLFETVSAHRRAGYSYGEVPNQLATKYCGSPILLLVASVDVHKDELWVAVWGWCRGRRVFLVDYWRLEGNTEQLDDPGTWQQLREIVERYEYLADDGKLYRIQLTLIDSGYRAEVVYRFAARYAWGVAPVKGREAPKSGVGLREFQAFTTPLGTTAYGITVDLYKDRWSASLRRSWDGNSQQPENHFNAPIDATDDQLRQLTVEIKREQIDARTGVRKGFEWHRPPGAANELWDLLVYANAALEIYAWHFCQKQLGLEKTNWRVFWDFLERHKACFKE